jgi:hypothetical protein
VPQREQSLETPTPTPPRKGGGEAHEFRRLALVAIAAAAVRFSTPSLA